MRDRISSGLIRWHCLRNGTASRLAMPTMSQQSGRIIVGQPQEAAAHYNHACRHSIGRRGIAYNLTQNREEGTGQHHILTL